MPTWLFGSCSVTTDRGDVIPAEFYGGQAGTDLTERWIRRYARWRDRAWRRGREHRTRAGVGRHDVGGRPRCGARRVVSGEPGDAAGVAQEPAVVSAGDDVGRHREPAVAGNSLQRLVDEGVHAGGSDEHAIGAVHHHMPVVEDVATPDRRREVGREG